MAKIIFSPQLLSGSIANGGTPSLPAVTGEDDNASPTPVAGPVWAPALNTSTAGQYVATYTIGTGTDIATEVTKTYTLTVQAAAVVGKGAPTPAEFAAGDKLRDNTVTTAEFKAAVTEGITIQDPIDVEIPAYQAAYFDEQGCDPYEVSNAQ